MYRSHAVPGEDGLRGVTRWTGAVVAVVACLALLATPAQAKRVTLGFDDLPTGTVVGEQYAALGVHFGQTRSGPRTTSRRSSRARCAGCRLPVDRRPMAPRGPHVQHRSRIVSYLDIGPSDVAVIGRLDARARDGHRATNGRIGERRPGLPSLLLLQHRRAPERDTANDPARLHVASAKPRRVRREGRPSQAPAWRLNLRANPDTNVQIGARRLRVRAREADADERRRSRPAAIAHNPRRRRATRA